VFEIISKIYFSSGFQLFVDKSNKSSLFDISFGFVGEGLASTVFSLFLDFFFALI